MHVLFQFAYLDPGTGSLIIQSIVGAIAGILVFGRRTITRARLALMQKFSKKSPDNNTKDTPAAVETKAASIDGPDKTDAPKKSGKSKR